MNHRNITFIFLLTLYTVSINYALKVEELVGGNLAYDANHKYQAAIYGRHNKTQARNLMCTGGIISDFFILSSAQCLVSQDNELWRVRFFVIVGLITLTVDANLTKEVLQIYTLGQNIYEDRNDLAILELVLSLDIENTPYLGKLLLPSINEKLEGREGLVAGYGSTSINSRTQTESRAKDRITENSKQNLTYAFVRIAESIDCQESYLFIDPAKEMCGIIKPNEKYDHRGICTHDDGAPLVFYDTVVGIANRNRRDCDDTFHGSIYSKVPYFLDFILGVLTGYHVPNTIIYENRMIR